MTGANQSACTDKSSDDTSDPINTRGLISKNEAATVSIR